jgi:hypothetical protein
MEYIRPTLTKDEESKAEKAAKGVMRKFGIQGVVMGLAQLCRENMLLLKEVNEHRAARGIAPLPVVEDN